MKKIMLFVWPVLLLGGCVFTQHELSIDSEPLAELATIQQETAIALSFIDERDSLNVGKRFGGFGAKITATELMESIKFSVQNMFTQKGYRLAAKNKPYDASVQVGIRSFNYDVTSGWWTAGEHVSVVLILESKREDKTLKKVYRTSDEKRIFFESFGSEIDKKMSKALNGILTQIAQDKELEQFLVSGI